MVDVRRYGQGTGRNNHFSVIERSDGIWVSYEDYAALRESHRELLDLLSWQRECRGVEFGLTVNPGKRGAMSEITISMLVVGEIIGRQIDEYEVAIARAEKL
jgi:hypothetical protein